jgi:hypothetical protein
LKAILAFTGKDWRTSRVRFEPDANTIVATDGRAMCVVVFGERGAAGECPFEIESACLDLADKEVTISAARLEATVAIGDGMGNLLTTVQAGGDQFPPWRKLLANMVPAVGGVAKVGLSGALLIKMVALGKAFGFDSGKCIFELATNDGDPVCVRMVSQDDCVAGVQRGNVSILVVLMSMRL